MVGISLAVKEFKSRGELQVDPGSHSFVYIMH